MENKFKKAFSADEIINAGKDEDVNINDDENINKGEDISKDVVEDEDEVVDEEIIIEDDIKRTVEVNKNSYVRIDETKDTGVDKYIDTDKNKLVMLKVENKNEIVRMTYYFKKHQIDKINEISDTLNIPKSEVVQTLIDFSLNNIIIE